MMSLAIGTLSDSDLVLTKVFERIHPVEMKNLRLVCKKWYQLSLPIWRRTGTVSIWQDGVTNIPQVLTVSKLVKVLEDPDEDKLKLTSEPFMNYKLYLWKIPESCCEDYSQFWKLAGPLIKSLKFEHCVFPIPPKKTPHVLRKLLEKMPNLEHLIFAGNWFHGGGGDDQLANLEPGEDYDAKAEKGYPAGTLHYGDDLTELLQSRVFPLKIEEDQEKLPTYLKLKSLEIHDKLPFLWKDFLGMFPKLEKIEVNKGHPGKDVGSIIEAISAIRIENPEAFQNLRLLEVEALQLKRKDIDLLKDLKLPVKSLGIPYLQDDKSTDCFMDELFATYAGTLTRLAVRRANWPSWKKLEYLVFTSPLENLTALRLEGVVVEDMEFLRKTPNLRLLMINQRFWEKIHPFENWTRRNEDLVELTDLDEDFTLKSMATIYILGDVKASSFKTLKKWMPNLMSINMEFTNESLWETYKLWPEMEEISFMEWSKVSEDGILGERRGQSSSNLGNMPSITDLNDLRSFSVISGNNVEALTDASVYNGLMKLERLTRFVVTAGAQIPASDEALKALSKKNMLRFYVVSRGNLLHNCTGVRVMRA